MQQNIFSKDTGYVLGTALAFVLMASLFVGLPAHAQTYDTTGATIDATTGSSTTPGVPVTGSGGEASINLMILLASATVILGGIYALRKQA